MKKKNLTKQDEQAARRAEKMLLAVRLGSAHQAEEILGRISSIYSEIKEMRDRQITRWLEILDPLAQTYPEIREVVSGLKTWIQQEEVGR